MIKNDSFNFPEPCCHWEIIQMPHLLLVTGNFIEQANAAILKHLQLIHPTAPLYCILFLKPARKRIEDLNENRSNVSNLD